MAFDNAKYHCEINTVPYIISGYHKSEMKAFLPRFTSGEQTESDFDLLKTKTIKGFSGGQWQKYWDDDTSTYSIDGLFPIYDDGVLYPVDDAGSGSGATLLGTTKAKVTAYLPTPDYLYIAYKLYGSTNAVLRLNTAGSVTAVTLPANMSNTARDIISIAEYNNQIWYGVSDGLTLGYSATHTTNSVTEIGSGTSVGCVSQLIVFRGQLYGTDGSGGDQWNAKLYRHTGGTGSRDKVEVGNIGLQNDSQYAKLINYNNRIFLMRKDGMWAYDGIQMIAIEDSRNNSHVQNYRFPQVLKGYLYYSMPDGFYRFNGSLVEKLYDYGETGYPTASTIGKNRIWLSFANSAASGSSRYDKAVGFDYSAGTDVDGRVAVFDGKGMYDYGRTATWTQASADFSGQGELCELIHFNNTLYALGNYHKIGAAANVFYTWNTNEQSLASTKAWRIVTSIYGADFPMIDKALENLEIILDGNVSANETITIEYRTAGFGGSTSWTSLGTFSTQTELKRFVFKTIAAGVTYKQIQFRIYGSTTVGYGIAKIVLRSILSPDFKWQWQFTVRCHGDNALELLQLNDMTSGAQAVSLLRGNIYSARASDQPIKFIDLDQMDLSGAHNDNVTTITLNTTALLKEFGFIQIDDEIIYYTAKTSTQLTGCSRAQLSTVAASHTDNSKVFAVYRVVLDINNESIELQDALTDQTEDMSRASDITVLLKEV